MSLVTLADFQAPSKGNPSKPVYAVIPDRINATEQARLMPPVSSSTLSAAELQTFNAWLSGGAKGVTTNACPIGPASAGTAGAGGAGSAGAGGGAAPSTASGGASLEPIEYGDPDMKCYKFLTHAQGDVNAPYMHGPGEEYINFSFKAPWTGTVYLRAVKIAVGDAPILHHWLLYKDTPAQPDGQITGMGTGAHPQSALLYGWAPGATPLYLDPDVGVQLDQDISLTIEAHINNATGATGSDHNGAEICVTPKKPEHLADLSWLGSDAIAGTSATGTCRPKGSGPIHIIAAQPHMHKKGTHMKVVINRAGGMSEVLHDKPFSFDDQRYYIENSVLMQGDTVTTTCTYSAPATLGQSTNNEMCYFFTLAWPANNLGTANLLHGANVCE
jgi:hypothetical protein